MHPHARTRTHALTQANSSNLEIAFRGRGSVALHMPGWGWG